MSMKDREYMFIIISFQVRSVIKQLLNIHLHSIINNDGRGNK